MNVRVVEFYRSHEPPEGARAAVQRVLARLPERYLLGLDSVVLRDSESLVGGERRGKTWSRAKKAGGWGVRYTEVMGLYRRARRGRPASLDLFVDQILRHTPTRALGSPVVLELALGGTLFHELGHHLHATQAPEHREREEVAERWRWELHRIFFPRSYFLRHYWRMPRLISAAMTRGNRWGFQLVLERHDVVVLALPVLLLMLPVLLPRYAFRRLRRRLRDRRTAHGEEREAAAGGVASAGRGVETGEVLRS